MALTERQREKLRDAVDTSRDLLKNDVLDQLERIYGFSRLGIPRPIDDLPLTSMERAAAEDLREWHQHLLTTNTATDQEAVTSAFHRMAEETAFTMLHRLAALRMAEERGVLQPCIRDGLSSDGFRLFLQYSGGALGRDEEAYVLFLQRLFDEMACDLPALFDRREPRSLVFPRPGCLEAVIASLNVETLVPAWQDDETIGWVYQDFHSAEERREMRRGIDVPQNARELAIRNQLFTPRWVVEFLTDNTLGSLWAEMTGGATSLLGRCPYLVRLHAQETPPKDPRHIRVLDPACGSGHFLLYAFDLLETIYLESWQLQIGTSPGSTPLWIEYPDKASFESQIPALILRHNLFGVDIDPRPLQVAALALWLRAQRSWKGVPFAQRPPIERMNLVCAEALPGDRSRLEPFVAALTPPILGDLVQEVWKAMRPVGEQGLLLRIEQHIRDIVRSAENGWQKAASITQLDLSEETSNWIGPRHHLSELATDEAARFWSEAEDRVIESLRVYAAEAGDYDRVLRRLFAEDAERGFALIDLSRGRYDVILMNPPFGQPAESTKEALDTAYPDCGHEIYAMFFRRTLELLESHGRLGAITNRSWLTTKTLRGLREHILGKDSAVTFCADAGYGVLEAKVETSIVVVDRRANQDTPATWIRLLKTRLKSQILYEAVQAISDGRFHPFVFISTARRFRRLPEGVYAYWMSDALMDRCDTNAPSLKQQHVEVVVGSQATPDFRFLRLAWEVDPVRIGLSVKWARLAKGGEYRPFWDDIYLLLNWQRDGAEVRALGRGRPQNEGYFGRRGVTWPRRTSSGFGPRVFNEGCAFGDKGPCAFPPKNIESAALLAILTADPQLLLLSTRLAAADDQPGAAAKSYEVGIIGDLPWPCPTTEQQRELSHLALRAAEIVRNGKVTGDSTVEAWLTYTLPPILLTGGRLPIAQAARKFVASREDEFVELSNILARIADVVAQAYGFTEPDLRVLTEELECPVASYAVSEVEIPNELFSTAYLTKNALPGELLPGGIEAAVDVRIEHRRGRQHNGLRDEETMCRLFEIPPSQFTDVRRRLDLLRADDLRHCAGDIVSWAVGVAFGRWDIRLLDHPGSFPAWTDPFGPLPRCPAGVLVNAVGLPATADRIAAPAWMLARSDVSRLPRVATDHHGTYWLLDSDGKEVVPAEVDSVSYPIEVAWDGLLQDDALDDHAPTRNRDDLYLRMSIVLEYVYRETHAEREAELAEALGVASLREWLRHPDRFFADHLTRYSRGNRLPRRAPLYWPLSTPSGGFTLWLYYPRISTSMLAACVNRLRTSDEILKREEEQLTTVKRMRPLQDAEADRLQRLPDEREERLQLREALRGLVDRGFRPDLDDGAVLNAGPVARWFRNMNWRDAAATAWSEVQAGEHDWSSLALWLRPDQVLERCRKEQHLAIAHGREDLYIGLPPKPKSRRSRKAVQLDLPESGRDTNA
jgi:hypothetical protein